MKNRFNFIVLLIAICCAGSALGQQPKQFLGIRAPETALNAPYVFDLQGKTTLFGLYYVDGRRDVSALQLTDDDRWTTLGENGNAITGVEGNFFSDFTLDKNKVPWLLTYYTRPSNPDREDRFFLYTLKENRWVLAGPKQATKRI